MQGPARVLRIRYKIEGSSSPVSVASGRVLPGAGFEGARASDGLVTILPEASARAADPEGPCAARFWENILAEDLDAASLAPGSTLSCGSAALRVARVGKPCVASCPIAARGERCSLARGAVFASVAAEGVLRVGDALVPEA